MKDPGLQRERTSLAWTRTGFVMALVALLSLRSGLAHMSLSQLLAAALMSGTAGLLLYRGHQRSRYNGIRDEVVAMAGRHLAALTSLVVLTAALLHVASSLLRLMRYYGG